MQNKKLTFMPDGNNTYAGFDGDEIVALVTPLDPKAIFGTTTWQWSARSEGDRYGRAGWTFPDREGSCAQREAELEDAAHRAAQHVGHGFIRPMNLCPEDCPVCPEVVILPPQEVDT